MSAISPICARNFIAGKTTALNGALLIADHPPILFCSGGEARSGRPDDALDHGNSHDSDHRRAVADQGFVRAILSPVLEKARVDASANRDG